MSDVAVRSDSKPPAVSALWGLPVRTEFSLEPLLKYWERELAQGDKPFATGALLEKVGQQPGFSGRVADPEALRAHPELLSALMLAVFSPTFQEDNLGAALFPFELRSFF